MTLPLRRPTPRRRLSPSTAAGTPPPPAGGPSRTFPAPAPVPSTAATSRSAASTAASSSTRAATRRRCRGTSPSTSRSSTPKPRCRRRPPPRPPPPQNGLLPQLSPLRRPSDRSRQVVGARFMAPILLQEALPRLVRLCALLGRRLPLPAPRRARHCRRHIGPLRDGLLCRF